MLTDLTPSQNPESTVSGSLTALMRALGLAILAGHGLMTLLDIMPVSDAIARFGAALGMSMVFAILMFWPDGDTLSHE